ncbi:MAG: DNA integrity scanning protein DisA nucleotide-binding domain protein, partial [Tidjanibacter sp.]|nr:DNA integrity scanning protein DisA nucleotide-binding domain protein [Tidjanibacter sp.]
LSFGMRHRAAMGLCEESDAIVVVVSEETGGISVAHNGRIRTGLSAIELKAELIRLNNEPVEAAKAEKEDVKAEPKEEVKTEAKEEPQQE